MYVSPVKKVNEKMVYRLHPSTKYAAKCNLKGRTINQRNWGRDRPIRAMDSLNLGKKMGTQVQLMSWDYAWPALKKEWSIAFDTAIDSLLAYGATQAAKAAGGKIYEIIKLLKEGKEYIKNVTNKDTSNEQRTTDTVALIMKVIATALRLATGAGLHVLAIIIDLGATLGKTYQKISETSDKLKNQPEAGEQLI
jgi:hypothetical protein